MGAEPPLLRRRRHQAEDVPGQHLGRGDDARELRAVARGRTNQEICGDLFVSLSTVKTHIGNIGSKLDARNRVEIAAWAWENRLVD